MPKLLSLPTHTDSRGALTVLEHTLPFTVQRSYWIYHTQDQSRGGHRHRVTVQALVCVHGTLSVEVVRGSEHNTYRLDAPNQCLLLEPEDWHRMHHFSEDAVLLVFASHPYDADDYILEPL